MVLLNNAVPIHFIIIIITNITITTIKIIIFKIRIAALRLTFVYFINIIIKNSFLNFE